jgi:hypothetical protein
MLQQQRLQQQLLPQQRSEKLGSCPLQDGGTAAAIAWLGRVKATALRYQYGLRPSPRGSKKESRPQPEQQPRKQTPTNPGEAAAPTRRTAAPTKEQHHPRGEKAGAGEAAKAGERSESEAAKAATHEQGAGEAFARDAAVQGRFGDRGPLLPLGARRGRARLLDDKGP